MASFALNKKEEEYIKEANSCLLNFYKPPWVVLSLHESVVAHKSLVNDLSDKERSSKYKEQIESLLKKIGK